jgi:hypothetical protein
MSEDFNTRVIAWLTKTGFPLEMRMAAACASIGFDVTQSIYYVDSETHEARETDILATKEEVSGAAWMRFFVVIECKAAKDAPWILFPRQAGTTDPAQRIRALTFPRLTSPLIARLSRRGDIRDSPAFASSPVPSYGMVQALREKPDHAFAASMSIAKAAAAILEEVGKNSEEEETFDIIWPVIITEAPLFEARLSGDGHIVVESVPRGVLAWRHPTAGRGIPLIDVVTVDAAIPFLKDLHSAAELILHNTTAEQAQVLDQRERNAMRAAPPAV